MNNRLLYYALISILILTIVYNCIYSSYEPFISNIKGTINKNKRTLRNMRESIGTTIDRKIRDVKKMLPF